MNLLSLKKISIADPGARLPKRGTSPGPGKKSNKTLKQMVIRVSLVPHPPPSPSVLLSLARAWQDARAVGASQHQAGPAQPLQGRGGRRLSQP